MTEHTLIRPLVGGDAEAFVELRRSALLDSPLSFGASPDDDLAATVESIRRQIPGAPDWVILGAFDGGALVGATGLVRDRHIKASHKVLVWGMYVSPEHRRRGIGAALMESAIRHARSLPGVDWLQLSVSSEAPAARRVYERAGFEEWGREPDALRHGGQSADEHHMALRLSEGGPKGD